MTRLSTARMDDYSFQVVLALVKRWKILSFLNLHVLKKVELGGELKFVVKLNTLISFNIKHHPHQVNNENIRKLIQTC